MSPEVYHQFIDTVRPFIQNRKFPTEDVCNVFNILVRISPYYEKSGLYASDSLPNSGQVLIGDQDLNQKFLQEIVGRIRHSIYDVPKDQFTLTMSNLIEFQQPAIANKFVNILKEILRQGKSL